MTIVHIHGPRGDEWERIAGTRAFPVRGLVPVLATLPGFEEPQPVYLLDLKGMPMTTLQRIVAHLCDKFGLSAAEAKDEIAKAGIPILAKDCSWITNSRDFL